MTDLAGDLLAAYQPAGAALKKGSYPLFAVDRRRKAFLSRDPFT